MAVPLNPKWSITQHGFFGDTLQLKIEGEAVQEFSGKEIKHPFWYAPSEYLGLTSRITIETDQGSKIFRVWNASFGRLFGINTPTQSDVDIAQGAVKVAQSKDEFKDLVTTARELSNGQSETISNITVIKDKVGTVTFERQDNLSTSSHDATPSDEISRGDGFPNQGSESSSIQDSGGRPLMNPQCHGSAAATTDQTSIYTSCFFTTEDPLPDIQKFLNATVEYIKQNRYRLPGIQIRRDPADQNEKGFMFPIGDRIVTDFKREVEKCGRSLDELIGFFLEEKEGVNANIGNLIFSISKMYAAIRTAISTELDGIKKLLNDDQQLTTVKKAFKFRLIEEISTLDGELKNLDTRLDRLNSRLKYINDRLEKIESESEEYKKLREDAERLSRAKGGVEEKKQACSGDLKTTEEERAALENSETIFHDYYLRYLQQKWWPAFEEKLEKMTTVQELSPLLTREEIERISECVLVSDGVDRENLTEPDVRLMHLFKCYAKFMALGDLSDPPISLSLASPSNDESASTESINQWSKKRGTPYKLPLLPGLFFHDKEGKRRQQSPILIYSFPQELEAVVKAAFDQGSGRLGHTA